MDEIKKTVTIDLAAYGMEGTIEMRKPGPRKMNQFLNSMSSVFTIGADGTPRIKEDVPFGDLQVAMILRYTSKAPYRCTPDSFWAFMDTVEAFDVDKANALYIRLVDAAKEVSKDSPFAGSRPQATGRSD